MGVVVLFNPCLMAPSSLDRIFQSAAASSTPSKSQTVGTQNGEVKELPGGYKKLPNGVIIDKDGKPYAVTTASKDQG